MFLDILDLIFDNFEGVVRAFDVPLLTVGTVDISFWELLLGIFTVSVIFGFFLVPRPGSVLSAAGNINEWNKEKARAEERSREADSRRAEAASRRTEAELRRLQNSSYEAYAARRFERESFSKRYNDDLKSFKKERGK